LLVCPALHLSLLLLLLVLLTVVLAALWPATTSSEVLPAVAEMVATLALLEPVWTMGAGLTSLLLPYPST
jgi:hypothetical protein